MNSIKLTSENDKIKAPLIEKNYLYNDEIEKKKNLEEIERYKNKYDNLLKNQKEQVNSFNKIE